MKARKKCIEYIFQQFSNLLITESEKDHLVSVVLANPSYDQETVERELANIRGSDPHLADTLSKLQQRIQGVDSWLNQCLAQKLRAFIGQVSQPANYYTNKGERVVYILRPITGLTKCQFLRLDSEKQQKIQRLGLASGWSQLNEVPQWLNCRQLQNSTLFCKLHQFQLTVLHFSGDSQIFQIFSQQQFGLLTQIEDLFKQVRLQSQSRTIRCSLLLFLSNIIELLPLQTLNKLLHQILPFKIQPNFPEDRSRLKLGYFKVVCEEANQQVVFSLQKHLLRLQRVLKSNSSSLKLLNKLVQAVSRDSALYVCFYRHDLVFACGRNSECWAAGLGSLITQRRQTFGRIGKSLGLSGQLCTRLEYSLQRNQQLIEGEFVATKEDQIIQMLQLAGQRPQEESELDKIRRKKRQMTKTNIRKGLAVQSYIGLFMPDCEVEEGKKRMPCTLSKFGSQAKPRRKDKRILSFSLTEMEPPSPDFGRSKPNALEMDQLQLIKFVYHTFSSNGFIEQQSLDLGKMSNFLGKLYFQYQKYSNPFHNFRHGVTVMQGNCKFGECPRFAEYFNSFWKFSFVLAGLCHDIGHTGRNNAFEVATNSKLAIRYFERSVLQSHHIALTFKLLNDDSSSFIQYKDSSDLRLLRKIVTQCILCTDGKFHTPKLNQLALLLKLQKNDSKIFENQQNKLILLGNSIHAADFYGNVQPFQISKSWAERLHQQFRVQYQLEHELQIEQTPFFAFLDDPVRTAGSQAIFISNIVLPVWMELSGWYHGWVDEQLQNINQNILKWQQLKQS